MPRTPAAAGLTSCNPGLSAFFGQGPDLLFAIPCFVVFGSFILFIGTLLSVFHFISYKSLRRSQSYPGPQYRRLRTPLGTPKAITAMARKTGVPGVALMLDISRRIC
jgi:hypothetical protein